MIFNLERMMFTFLKQNLKRIKIDWMLIFLVIILFIQLYSVHYNYTGKIATINGIEEVRNARITYPYYSDEWGAVSLIKYSIESKSLAFVNPLWKNEYFANFEFASYSFLSGLFILFRLNPLTDYPVFSLFFGMLICILVYFILRLNNVKKIPAGIATLLVPYIVNSANLPGIWYLIPVTFGVVSLLLGFIFISLNNRKMILLAGFLTLIFYPPFFILYVIAVIFYFISEKISIKEKMKYLLIYFGLSLLIVLALLFWIFLNVGTQELFNILYSKIFYFSFTGNSIPDYSIWKVIPIPLLLLSVVGFVRCFIKKKWLSAPLLIGLIYWLAYSQIPWRFIIEYQRIVLISSIILVLFSGFGLDFLLELLNKNKIIQKFNLVIFLEIILLLSLAFFSFSYTNRENWSNLKLHLNSGEMISPSPPASKYLHEDDLILFQNISKNVFISPPWKGLVIGAATGNYPLDTKDATIGVDILKYSDFIDTNCINKKKLAIDYKIDYVYSSAFDCANFKFIGKSREGLYLYESVNIR